MRTIYLHKDEVTVHGFRQFRVQAVQDGVVLHTVLRWSEAVATQTMRLWLSKNVALVQESQIAN
jgi:hypothetical protein